MSYTDQWWQCDLCDEICHFDDAKTVVIGDDEYYICIECEKKYTPNVKFDKKKDEFVHKETKKFYMQLMKNSTDRLLSAQKSIGLCRIKFKELK